MIDISVFLKGKSSSCKWRFTKYFTGVEESAKLRSLHIKQEEDDILLCKNRPTDIESIKGFCIEWVQTYVSPDFQFRQYQLEYIVTILYNILNENTKINCVEAPTGSGKSWIAFVIAGVAWEYYRKTSYILVSDLGLLQQYFDDVTKYKFSYFGKMKGLANYRCDSNGLPYANSECKLAKVGYNILMDEEKAKSHGFECALTCPLMLDRKRAILAPVTIMTYVLYMTHMNEVAPYCQTPWPPFDKRDIVICDEVHEMPSIVQSYCSPTFDIESDALQFKNIKKFLLEHSLIGFTDFQDGDDSESEETSKEDAYSIDNLRKTQYSIVEAKTKDEALEALKVYNHYQKLYFDKVEVIRGALNDKLLKGDSLDKDERSVLFSCDWLDNRFKKFDLYPKIMDSIGSDKMVVNSAYDPKTKSFDKKLFAINCVYEEWLVDHFFNQHCGNEVMLSATMGDPTLFRRAVGVETWFKMSIEEQNKNFKFLRIPSTFDFSKSPIYVIPNFKLTYNLKEQNLPSILNIISQILNAHKNQRGLIHTGSYEFSKKLSDGIMDDNKNRLICYTGARNKELALSEYSEIENAVLCGPTLTTGVNLPDDLCRFMIVMKVPYPSLGDQLVKAKKDIIPNWYIGETVKTMTQSFGRGIRHKSDWCITYIVDGSFVSVFKQGGSMLAPELINRIRYVQA